MNTTSSDPQAQPTWEEKLEALRRSVRQLESALVCLSGGLDSGLMLAIAREQLGDDATGLTATGPALAPSELQEATVFARTLGVRHELRDAGELTREGYRANGPDRCFHCKTALYDTARAIAAERGIRAVVNGTNVDDLGDYRPGLEAATLGGVRSPLVEAGFNKADVREAAKHLGLALWDKPAAACLASRLPYGTEVTPRRLEQIAAMEAQIRQLGVARVRVRHHETIARLEVDAEDIARLATSPLREAVVEAGKAQGFTYVVLDLGGYRMGSHNEVLDGRHLRTLR